MNAKRIKITFDNQPAYYWEYNPNSKTTLVMIHGFRGTHHGLEQVAAQLTDYRLIIPDLPGFGESAADDNLNLDTYIDFVGQLITSLNISTPPVLIGHSFGSIITSHFASRHPGTISRLILINPIATPALHGPRGILTRLTIGYYTLGRILPPNLSRRWLSSPTIVNAMSIAMTKSNDKLIRRFVRDQHLTHFSSFANPKVVEHAFAASISHDVSQVANTLTVPTLLIAGEKDDISPIKSQHRLKDMIPYAQLEVIPDVGHLTHYETPSAVAKAIQDFLQQ